MIRFGKHGDPGRSLLVSLAQKRRGIHESAGLDMIGMRVFPVGREEVFRLQLADLAGELVPRVEIVLEEAIAEAEVAAPVEAEDGGRCRRLRAANLGAAVRRWLAVRQLEHAHLCPLTPKQQDGAAGGQFGVVRMRGDNQIIQHGVPHVAASL